MRRWRSSRSPSCIQPAKSPSETARGRARCTAIGTCRALTSRSCFTAAATRRNSITVPAQSSVLKCSRSSRRKRKPGSGRCRTNRNRRNLRIALLGPGLTPAIMDRNAHSKSFWKVRITSPRKSSRKRKILKPCFLTVRKRKLSDHR